MIAVQRDYTLQDAKHFHAHIEVKVCGTIEVDISETDDHFTADLDHVEFKQMGDKTKVIVITEEDHKKWQLILDRRDAAQLHNDVDNAAEEFEILMNDLS